MQNGNGHNTTWQSFGDVSALRTPRSKAVQVHHRDPTVTRAAADLYETDDVVVLVMDLPGHDPSAMELGFERGVLHVRSPCAQRVVDGRNYHLAERASATVERAFEMPASIDPERIDATFEAGVLTVTLHKREESKPRRIEVKVTS